MKVSLAILVSLLAIAQPPSQSHWNDSCARYSGNPVLSAGPTGAWDSGGVGNQNVISNGTYFDMLYSNFSPNNITQSIGLAYSKDGVNWTHYAAPVLTPGGRGSWDDLEVRRPSVVWNGSQYLMYYTGSGTKNSLQIGLAFSKDLIHWQKYGDNPILHPGPGEYDNTSLRFPSVIYDPPTYKMWYVGRFNSFASSETIEYATSTDGIHWSKYPANPVMTLSTANSGYAIGPNEPSVVKTHGAGYVMAVEYDAVITFAYSSDGMQWSSVGTPLLVSVTNESLSYGPLVDFPSLVLDGSRLFLWYTNFANNTNPSASVTVDLAICPLILSTATTTKTLNSIATTVGSTITLTTTVQTTIETARLQTSEVQVYQISSIILASLVIVTMFLLARKRK